MSVFLININREKFGEFGSIYYFKESKFSRKIINAKFALSFSRNL